MVFVHTLPATINNLCNIYNYIFAITIYAINFFRLMLTEAYTSINYTMMYYSQETPRAHMPFNFNMILYLNKSSSAIDIKNVINMWIDNMPTGQWANWVVSIKLCVY